MTYGIVLAKRSNVAVATATFLWQEAFILIPNILTFYLNVLFLLTILSPTDAYAMKYTQNII